MSSITGISELRMLGKWNGLSLFEIFHHHDIAVVTLHVNIQQPCFIADTVSTLGPAVCIGCASDLGFAGVLNSVAAEEKLDGEAIAGC